MIPPTPKDPPSHTIRRVSMPHSPSTLSSDRKSTIGQSMAKVKAFMEKSGNQTIQNLGSKISGDYDFHIFRQASGGFLLEIGDQSVFISHSGDDTQEIALEIQKIWDNLFGASISGSTTPSTSVEPPLPPLPSSPRLLSGSSPESIPSPLPSEPFDVISDATKDHATAINAYYDVIAKKPQSLPYEDKDLLALLKEGEKVLNRDPLATSAFTPDDCSLLFQSNRKLYDTTLLDLFLLDDIQKQAGIGCFKQAAVSYTLLSPEIKNKLQHQLLLPFIASTFPACTEVSINQIAQGLKKQKSLDILDTRLEAVKGSIRFRTLNRLSTLRATQTQTAHTQAISALRAINQQLSIDKRELKEELHTYLEYAHELNLELAAIEKRLQEKDDLAEALASELDQSRAAYTQLHTRSSTTIDSLETQLQNLQKEQATNKAKILELEQTNASLTAQLHAAEAALTTLSHQKEAAEGGLAASQRQQESLRAQILALSETIDQKLTSLGTTDSLGTDAPSLKAKMAILIRAFETKELAADQKIKALNDHLRSLQSAYQKMQTDKDAALMTIEKLKASQSELEAIITKTQEEKAALRAELEATQTALNAAEARIVTLEGTLATQATTIEELQTSQEAMSEAIAKKDKELSDLHQELEKAQNALKIEAAAHKEALKEAATKFQQAAIKLSSLEAENSALKQEEASIRAELARQTDLIKALETAKASLEVLDKDQKDEIEALKTDFSEIARTCGLSSSDPLTIKEEIGTKLKGLETLKTILEEKVSRLGQDLDRADAARKEATQRFKATKDDLEGQIRVLKETNASQASNIEAQVENITRLNTEAAKLQSSLKEMRSQTIALSSQLTAMEVVVETKEALIKTKDQALEKLKGSIAALQEELSRNKEELEATLSAKTSLQAELKDAIAKGTSSDKALQQQADTIFKLQQTLEAQRALTAQLSSSHLASIEELKTSLLKQKNATIELQTSMAALLAQAKTELEKAQLAFQVQNKILIGELRVLSSKNAVLEQKASKLLDLEKALNPKDLTTPADIEEHFKIFQKLQAQQTAFQTALGSLGKSPDAIKKDLSEQEEKLSSLAIDLEAKVLQINEKDALIAKLQEAVASSSKELAETSADYEKRITSLEETKAKAEQLLAEKTATFAAALSSKDKEASKKIQDLGRHIETELAKSDALEAQNRALKATLEDLEARATSSLSETSLLQKQVGLLKKQTAQAKLLAFIEKRALKEKAKAFSFWRLQTLAQKKEKEKQELLGQVQDQSKILESLATKHDSVISFLKSNLSSSETLDPTKPEEQELIRIFNERLIAQDKAARKASLDLEDAATQMTSQAEILASQEAKITKLELSLAQRDQHIGTLQAALTVIEDQQRALQASLEKEKADNRAAILELQKELEATTTTKKALEKELLEAQAALPILQAKLDESIQAQDLIKGQLETLQRNYDALKIDCDDKTKKLAEATSLNATLHRTYNQIQEETALRIAQIQKENKEALDKLAALLEAAKINIGEKEEEIKALQIELDAIKTSSAKDLAAVKKERAASLASLTASHEKLITEKEDQLKEKHEELAALKDNYTRLAQDQKEASEMLKTKEAALNSAISTKTSLEKANVELRGELAKLTEDFKVQEAILAATITDKQARLDALDAENRSLNSYIASLLSSFEVPAPDIDSAIKRIQRQTRTIKDLEKKLDEKHGELSALDTDSRKEAISLRAEIKGLQESLSAAKKAISTISIENHEALSTLLSQLGSLAPTIPEITKVLTAISTLENPLDLSKIVTHLAPLPSLIEEKFQTLKQSYTTSIEDLTSKLDVIKTEQAALQTSLEASKEQIATLSARLQEQEAINQKNFAEALDRFKSALTTLAEGKDTTIKGLVDQIRTLKSQNQDTSKKITQLELLNTDLASKIKAEVDKAALIEKEGADEIARLKEELKEKEGIQTKVQQQLAQIHDQEATIQKMQKEIIASKARSTEISAELVISKAEATTTIETLRGNLTLLQAEANGLQTALDEAKAANDRLRSERASALEAQIVTQTQLDDSTTALTSLRDQCAKLIARNGELQRQNTELTAGGAAALEAQKAAQEQLRASLEMVKILTEEALPKTAYGRFDALYSNHFAALMSALKDHVDLNRRIQYALNLSGINEERLSESCKKAIITLSLPFADDITHKKGTLDSIVTFENASFKTFPILNKLMIDEKALTKINDKSKDKTPTASDLYKTCQLDISEELAKASGTRPLGVGAATAAGAASGGSGTADAYSLSTTLAPAVGLLLHPATGTGRFGVDNLFKIFMDKKAIINSLTGDKEARKIFLASEITKHHTVVTSATHLSSSKETTMAAHLLLSHQEELDAIKAFETLSSKYSEDIIFVALNQRFSKDIAYFSDEADQKMIDAITSFITHKHLDNLLNLMINNQSIAKDLCVKRILAGTQLISHAYKEKLELSRALKSGFNLLNQLYTAVFLRLP